MSELISDEKLIKISSDFQTLKQILENTLSELSRFKGGYMYRLCDLERIQGKLTGLAKDFELASKTALEAIHDPSNTIRKQITDLLNHEANQ